MQIFLTLQLWYAYLPLGFKRLQVAYAHILCFVARTSPNTMHLKGRFQIFAFHFSEIIAKVFLRVLP
jgi:hypothetical protein